MSATLLAAVDPYARWVDAAVGDRVPLFSTIAQQTLVPRRFVSSGTVGFLALFAIFGLGQSLMSTLIGVIYPAYQSMKALESATKDDDTQWLTYWVVFSCFTVTEMFVDWVLFWVPFYYSAKIAFLVWLMHPATRGAEVMWRSLLRGLFLKYVCHIDGFLNEAGTAGSAVTAAARTAATTVFAAGGGGGHGGARRRGDTGPPPLASANDIFGEAPVPGSKTD